VDSAVKSAYKGGDGALVTDLNQDCSNPRSKCFTPEKLLQPLQQFESQMSKDKAMYQDLVKTVNVKSASKKAKLVESQLNNFVDVGAPVSQPHQTEHEATEAAILSVQNEMGQQLKAQF